MPVKIAPIFSAIPALLAASAVSANTHVRLEEVIVTAQKRSENVLQVPIAIEVLDGRAVQEAGMVGLSQIEASVPSVNFGRGERKTRGEITIRGVGDYARNIGTEARVAVYIDDVPLGRSSAFDASLIDIKQIEILKGPQGTLFGTNTIAGAINVTTQAPAERFSLTARADVGNFDHHLLSLKSDMPLTDNFLTSFQFHTVDNEGYIDNLTRGDTLQGTDMAAGRAKFVLTPSDQLHVRLNFDWLEEDILATNGLALADVDVFNGFSLAPGDREVAHDADEFEQREIGGASLKADWQLGSGYQLESISAYRYSEFEEQSEEDYSPMPLATSRFDEEFRQFTQEFRLLSKKMARTDFVLGMFLSDQNTKTQRSATLRDMDTGTDQEVVTPGELDTTSAALFANGHYHITPEFSLNFGLRYQREEKKLRYRIEDSTGLFTNGAIDERETYKALLPKLGISFHLEDVGLVYYSVSRGTKSGGWNADFVTSLEDLSFDQEFATSVEIGYKNSLYDGRFSLNIAAFNTHFTDFQVFQFVEQNGATLTRLTNAGEATSKGIELNSNLHLSDYLMLTLNAAYTRAEFDQFADGGSEGVDYDGNALPYAPELTAYAALDVNYPLLRDTELSLHVDYSYSDGYFSNPNNAATHEVDDFYEVNARIGLQRRDNWSVFIWGKNLTDERYLRYRDISFLGIPRGYFAPPRTYGLSVTFTY